MVKSRILIEGGGESKELQTRCREAFNKLLKKCGYKGRLPRLEACGSRDRTYKDFSLAHSQSTSEQFVAMLVDSEDPVQDPEAPWQHLKTRDNWECPQGASDDQVFLMTTSMETWIATDQQALRKYYGSCLQESALVSLTNIEGKSRESIYDALTHATRDCSENYDKGANSFKVLSTVDPAVLDEHLPSFRRFRRILNEHL